MKFPYFPDLNGILKQLKHITGNPVPRNQPGQAGGGCHCLGRPAGWFLECGRNKPEQWADGQIPAVDQALDEIKPKQDQLIAALEMRIKQKTLICPLFRIRWWV